jgi:hypothetical protein
MTGLRFNGRNDLAMLLAAHLCDQLHVHPYEDPDSIKRFIHCLRLVVYAQEIWAINGCNDTMTLWSDVVGTLMARS